MRHYHDVLPTAEYTAFLIAIVDGMLAVADEVMIEGNVGAG